MNPRFADKTAKVVVVDTSGAVRQLLTEVVRSHGYKAVQGVATIKDALAILEVESIDWIIAPLGTEQAVNAMQMLLLVTQNHDLRDTRLSLVVDESELDALAVAYENGLLSHIEKPFNKESIMAAFTEFFSQCARYEWDQTKVASFYLRAHLRARKLWDHQVALEKSLLMLYPGEVEFLYELARPLHELGLADEAKSALYQAQLVDPKVSDKVEALARELFGNDDLKNAAKTTDGTLSINVLGIKNCMVIESDSASRRSLVSIVKSLGVEEILEFEDGASAWEWVTKNADPSLVLQEWRLPKVTGPLLIQRLRKKCPCLPIVLVSSLITVDDMALVKEMGVAHVIEKPFDSTKFIKSLLYVLQQDKMPSEAETLETKIRQLLEAGHYEEAAKLSAKYKSMPSIPENRKKKMIAEFAFVEKNYTLARDLTVEAIKGQSDSITMLNFLGKCLMKLKDFKAALKCFEKAQALSPMNVQRLCSIAEVHGELGDLKSADAALAKAKKIDKDREDIVETETSIKIAHNKTDEARVLLSQMQSVANLVAMMNNKAVAYSRAGEFDEGISIYQKTLAALPEDKKAMHAVVNYNLALAYARQEKLTEARSGLEKVLALGPSKMQSKSQSLLKRINQAITNKVELALLEEGGRRDDGDDEKIKEDGETVPLDAHKIILATLAASPGELCCYKVFVNPQTPSDKIKKLTAAIPHFVRRDTIERASADGLEKSFKAS